MARDEQIRLGDGTAPQQYTVPNAAEIVAKAINATFVGSGASGNFVPTAEIVSDGGVVVARVPCQTTVTAGGSAEVTFAPFLREDTPQVASGLLATWAGQWIDLTGTPLTVNPWPNAGDEVEPFKDTNGELFFRTNDTGMYSLFTTDRIHGDPSIVIHKGGTPYAFYAEAGMLMAPTGGTGWVGVTPEIAAAALYMGMEYTGPDSSIDPNAATQPLTSPAAQRAEWEGGDTDYGSIWFIRHGTWIDANTATDDWTLAFFVQHRDPSIPGFDIFQAYLHLYATPVVAGEHLQTIPIGQ